MSDGNANKSNPARKFVNGEVLDDVGLNTALKDYGNKEGGLPYDENSALDEKGRFPLGAKGKEWGSLNALNFNIYTTAEVLFMVTSGKLTNNSRMLFWNSDTDMLNAWNGQEIITVGGGSSMDYLYGDGSDGDVTFVANSNFTKQYYQYNNLKINPGITVGMGSLRGAVILSVKGVCDLEGATINFSGMGGLGGTNTQAPTGCDDPLCAYVNCLPYGTNPVTLGNNKTMLPQVTPSSFGAAGSGAGGSPPASAITSIQAFLVVKPDDSIFIPRIKSGKAINKPLFGGGGGALYGSGTAYAYGGNGGGGLIIYANEFKYNNFTFLGNGNNGITGAGSSHSGGGGGGAFMVGAKSISGIPLNINVNGGAPFGSGTAGTAGIKLVVKM